MWVSNLPEYNDEKANCAITDMGCDDSSMRV